MVNVEADGACPLPDGKHNHNIDTMFILIIGMRAILIRLGFLTMVDDAMVDDAMGDDAMVDQKEAQYVIVARVQHVEKVYKAALISDFQGQTTFSFLGGRGVRTLPFVRARTFSLARVRHDTFPLPSTGVCTRTFFSHWLPLKGLYLKCCGSAIRISA